VFTPEKYVFAFATACVVFVAYLRQRRTVFKLERGRVCVREFTLEKCMFAFETAWIVFVAFAIETDRVCVRDRVCLR